MSDPIIKKAVFNEASATWTTDTDKVFAVGHVLNLAKDSPAQKALDALRLSYEELLAERGALQETLANTFMNFRAKYAKPPENYDELNSKLAYQALRLAAYTDRTGFYKSLAEIAIFSDLGYFIGLSMKFTADGSGLVVTIAPPREGDLQHENITSMAATVSEYVSEGAKFAAMISQLNPILKDIQEVPDSLDQEVNVAGRVPALHLPIASWPKLLGMFGWVFASFDLQELPNVFPDIFANINTKDPESIYILGVGTAHTDGCLFIHVIPPDAVDPAKGVGANIKNLVDLMASSWPETCMSEFTLAGYALLKTTRVDEIDVPTAAIVTKDGVVTYAQNQINGTYDTDSDLAKNSFDLSIYEPLTNLIKNA